MASGIKYALLLLPTHFDQETGDRQLLPDMISWRGKLSDLIAAAEVSHWKEWLGDIDWRFYDREVRLVLVTMPSQAAEMFDDETKALRQRLGIAFYAMLLAAPSRPFSGVAQCVHGEALSVTPVVLKTVHGKENIEAIERPYYDKRLAFTKLLQDTPGLLRDPYLDRWAELVKLLDTALKAGLPRILNVAFSAFKVALTRDSLEFAVPEFVRTVECILGLPRGKGGNVFADRAMRVARQLQNHWYVGGKDLQARIEELYQHRSDCVHGKVPFHTLLSAGAAGEDEAARFGYLAEALARECLLWVLNHPQHLQYFADRPTLEDAWAKNLLP
ncbi:MAG: hypothetical protein RL701_5052 [Pseudomonadota bacterium]|jgi:hypothetical protein